MHDQKRIRSVRQVSRSCPANIVFCSTRQWNPGDEFILFGILHLFEASKFDFNALVFNRSPESNQYWGAYNPLRSLDPSNSRWLKVLAGFIRIGFLENSFHPVRHANTPDAVVFAGTPEWSGRRLRKVYEFIDRNDIPTMYLGIGSHGSAPYASLDALSRKVLESSTLVTVRDESTLQTLAPIKPVLLPCPALFSVRPGHEKRIDAVRRIGLIFGTDASTQYQRIAKPHADYLVRLYKTIREKFGKQQEIEIVCHYIDEVAEAKRLFPGCCVRYSYDAGAYENIYRRYDIVVGPRVHGIGIAASLGIPGILLKHDGRADTVAGFCAEISEPEEAHDSVLRKIERIDSEIEQRNKLLISHKGDAFTRYVPRIEEAFAKLRR